MAILSAACGGATERVSSKPPAPDVVLQTFAFSPKVAQVEVGTEITWRNDDDILHTVTSGLPRKQGVPGVSEDREARPDGLFNADLELDETFSHTFTDPGEYSYYCDIHSGMLGKIVVK